ncbi:hypothetical protein HPB50_017991 [Hyalomma asiaticum]|uniref:Uncharacterized protein n=1 Tax=Hyalomma asiaticum TaxID=266040 RepID=A0ACB7T3C4_HYAAI|nr:hypothetical protein HPB50_017991 [Hyalomma asiaticum]
MKPIQIQVPEQEQSQQSRMEIQVEGKDTDSRRQDKTARFVTVKLRDDRAENGQKQQEKKEEKTKLDVALHVKRYAVAAVGNV